MKKMILILTMIAMVFSCKKSDPAPVSPGASCKISSSTIAGTYLKTAVKYKASSTTEAIDWFGSIEDCKKDDLYELKADSSVVIHEGASTCTGPPPPGAITTWYLMNNNTELVFGAFLTIDSFDCTRLVVTEKNYLVTGDAQITTYVKQ
jgi:hypothetical protein